MRNWLAMFLISIPTWLLLSGAGPSQERGTIRGTVVDENGAPVNKAQVNADPLGKPSQGSLVRYVETDANGQFLINRLVWGKYRVFAKKEEDGYSDMKWSFYSNDVFKIVAVTSETPVAKLRIKLGPKCAILTGFVSNAVTGAPVSAGFKLIRATDRNKWISTSLSPTYRLLLPSSTDVLLEVSAPGFNAWTPPNPLHLQPGTELHMDVPLKPSHDPKLRPSKFLIPDGYVGWLLLEYGVKDTQPVPIEAGVEVFKFPSSGTLNTSSAGPQRGAEDEYFYYSAEGSLREIRMDYRNGSGMVWGQYEGTRDGALAQFGFFVGKEELYKKYRSGMIHPGPISTP